MEIPPEAKKSLEGLEPPLRVVALLGPGRTGKSTLAGHLVGDESVFPSAKPIGPVTEGINAAAVPHPNGGTLLVLDGESRKDGGRLCLLLASVVVWVDFDRRDEGSCSSLNDLIFSSLNELMACSEVIAGPESEKPPNLFLAINRCREKCDDQTLEKALELRDGPRIKAAFPCRSFCAVPCDRDRSYASRVKTFRERIVFEAHPLMFNDLPFDGSMFFQLLCSLVEKCRNSGKIETQDIYKTYETVVWEKLKATADRAIASFGSHYPVDAQYRNELDSLDFNFDYDRFLQPLRSEENHRRRSYEDVRKLVEHCQQAMKKHASAVVRENKRKGDEVVERYYKTRLVLIRRSYEKQSNASAIVDGATTGVVSTGGAAALYGSAIALTVGGMAIPVVGFLVVGAGAAGAAVFGWGAAQASGTYIRTSRYTLEKRHEDTDWTRVKEVNEAVSVTEEKDWKKDEVSEESEWLKEACPRRQISL